MDIYLLVVGIALSQQKVVAICNGIGVRFAMLNNL